MSFYLYLFVDMRTSQAWGRTSWWPSSSRLQWKIRFLLPPIVFNMPWVRQKQKVLLRYIFPKMLSVVLVSSYHADHFFLVNLVRIMMTLFKTDWNAVNEMWAYRFVGGCLYEYTISPLSRGSCTDSGYRWCLQCRMASQPLYHKLKPNSCTAGERGDASCVFKSLFTAH